MKIPYDGREFIRYLPIETVLHSLPWRNVLSTLFKKKRKLSLWEQFMVSFPLDRDDSERAWQRALTRPVPPVHKTELSALARPDLAPYKYYEAKDDDERTAGARYKVLGDK